MKQEKEQMLQFFAYEHLPEDLQKISKPFGEMARKIVKDLPGNIQREKALDKLLEAKDCAVRSSLTMEHVLYNKGERTSINCGACGTEIIFIPRKDK